MYPTLFQIGTFKVDTYSAVWLIALSLAIIWSIRRLDLYGLDEYESRRIMAVSFFGMLLGSRSYEYIRHFGLYISNPSLLLDLNRGGVHEVGAIAGAFISAWVMCLFNRKVSFMKLCDVAAPPAMLAIAAGRWGCFFNGCCAGLHTEFFTGVHFPFDRAGILRHPVQIYYSLTASVIVLVLLAAERWAMPRQRARYHPVTAPLAMVLYSLMRFAVAPLRVSRSLSWLVSHDWTYRTIMIAFPLECLWLVWSLLKINTDSSYK